MRPFTNHHTLTLCHVFIAVHTGNTILHTQVRLLSQFRPLSLPSTPLGCTSFHWTSLGDAGNNGRDGVPGVNGTDGVPGVNGTDGVPGVNGTDGVPGVNGTDGVPGVNGRAGVPGSKGRHLVKSSIQLRMTVALSSLS